MSSKIITLSDSQDNTLIPKTKLEAISDANGDYLSSSLTASDINALTSNSVVTHDDISVHSSIPINADRLNGHADTYFATADAVASLRATLLWTNADPSQTFNAQTIPLDLTDYSLILVQTDVASALIAKGNQGCVWEVFQNTIFRTRYFTVSDSGVAVGGGGYYAGNFTFVSNNAHAIPLCIYGIK